ncbi:hypothetical protein CLF_109259 [Clonorchis sinensis]|uniref:Uncharacterized protein n=1 Tax=Clonorchis sinensis TaxID=79923 RepID=G7YJ46_CLOSI|nr:hypothetical protein CLF_109259 [Clonorchis sinensis]
MHTEAESTVNPILHWYRVKEVSTFGTQLAKCAKEMKANRFAYNEDESSPAEEVSAVNATELSSGFNASLPSHGPIAPGSSPIYTRLDEEGLTAQTVLRRTNVFYFFIRNESQEWYDVAVEHFVRMMSPVNVVQTIVVDKNKSQLCSPKTAIPDAAVMGMTPSTQISTCCCSNCGSGSERSLVDRLSMFGIHVTACQRLSQDLATSSPRKKFPSSHLWSVYAAVVLDDQTSRRQQAKLTKTVGFGCRKRRRRRRATEHQDLPLSSQLINDGCGLPGVQPLQCVNHSVRSFGGPSKVDGGGVKTNVRGAPCFACPSAALGFQTDCLRLVASPTAKMDYPGLCVHSIFAMDSQTVGRYAVNLATLFGESLDSRLLCNVHGLVHFVEQFERISGSYYSVRNSKADSSGSETFIKYQCHRKGFARRLNYGKRRRLLDHTLEAYFTRFSVPKHLSGSNENVDCYLRNWRPSGKRLSARAAASTSAFM